MKGSHRPSQRVVLPNGMWLLLYGDGETIKLAGYNRKIRVSEVLNRSGGAHVFVKVEPDGRPPHDVAPRADDLVTVPRSVISALQRARS